MNWAKATLPRLALIVVLVAGAWVRLDYARSGVAFQGDENTAALMALHIARGEDFPLYFYGQRYMGGIAPYAIAAVFLVEEPSELAVGVGMLPFSLLWMWALYLLFGRLINRWAGVVAAAAVAFGPPDLVRIGVAPWIGYVPTFAYGALILYFGVRLADSDLSSRAATWSVVAMGALAGLSIWTNPLCLPYLIVGFGLLVAHVVRRQNRRGMLRRLTLGFAAFLVTLSPVIVTAARYGFAALFGFRPSSLALVPDVLRITFDRYIPETFGFYDGNISALSVIAMVCILGPIAALLVEFVVGIVQRNKRVVRAALVPLLFVAAFLPFYLTSPLAAKYNPRYFLTFYPLIAAAFAFPLVWRRAWLTGIVLAIGAFLVVASLLNDAWMCSGKPAEWARLARAARARLVQEIEQAGLRHVMLDSDDWHALTWAARERVIFAKPWGERYYPYLAAAIADDNAGFCVPDADAHVFIETLRTLGVASYDELSAGGWTVFHNLSLPTQRFVLVEPVAASLVSADGTIADGAPLVDGDEETILGEHYEANAPVVLDLGEPINVTAVRLVAPDEWDLPSGYAIDGSTDGTDWTEIQRVGRRLGPACIDGNRLFCRGRGTPMECRFSSVPVRYLKFHDFAAPAAHRRVWRFQEVYVCRETGSGSRPDAAEAAQIARMLVEAGVDFAVCDPWLSAKIAATSNDAPSVLPYYSNRHAHSQVSRVLPVREGVAIVVENAYSEQAKQLLEGATLDELQIETRASAHYTAHIIKRAPDAQHPFPGLKWNGFTLVRTARIAAAQWYHGRGRQLERAGNADAALGYYRRSFDTYPGIRANLERLASRDADARRALDRYTPAVQSPCSFPHGISLVGYTLTPSPLVPGEPATLRLVWALEGGIPYDYLPVFVHFDAGRQAAEETIRFQADHNVLFPLLPRTTVPRCLVLDEHTFTVPADCPPGELVIRLGAVTWWDKDRRLRLRTNLRHRDRAVEIGTTRVQASAMHQAE